MGRTEDIEEHRLAVVMNGGVSLAVWMGGFARQLDDVRRASLGRPAPPGDEDEARAEHRLHELWCGHTASTRVIVDVVAGTSAGGLNGVLLATAIAGDTPLTMLRSLWMRAAQLDEQGLLRPQEQAASVLSGGYFLDQIRGALRELAPTGGTGDDVVLTVTATALKGGPRTVRDACGAVFTQPDHRRRFTFARTGRHVTYAAPTDGGDGFTTTAVDDLTDVETLAVTARASASFPAAFEPVRESSGMRDRRRWPTWATGGPEWLADGGILDNSPFEPVLRSISERPVESTWRRTLCYVVPSADESDPGRSIPAPDPAPDPASDHEGPQPPWTSVLAAALGLPREADLRDDVEQIHDVLRAGRSNYDVRRLRLLLADRTRLTQAVGLATAGFGLYREARAAAGVYQIRDATLPPELFVRSPGEVVPDDVLQRRDLRWLPSEFPTTLPSEWTWGLAAAQRVVAVLLRSLAHDRAVGDELRAGLSTVKLQVAAVDRAVHDELATRTLPDDDPVAAAELADRVFDDLEVPTALERLVVGAVGQYAALKLGDEGRALEVLQAALCTEVVNGAGGVPVETRPRPLFDFRRMGVSEPPRLFAAAVAEARRTAPAGGNGASDLLYGTRLGHFAAFGRPAWREWDWLWGRISATVHLGRLLGLDDDAVDALVEEVVAAEGSSVEEVRRGIAQVLAVDDRQLLGDLRADGLLPAALDSVFALLASARETAPPLPRLVARAGTTASLLAARHHPRGGSTLQRVGRGSTLVVRRWWWRRLAR